MLTPSFASTTSIDTMNSYGTPDAAAVAAEIRHSRGNSLSYNNNDDDDHGFIDTGSAYDLSTPLLRTSSRRNFGQFGWRSYTWREMGQSALLTLMFVVLVLVGVVENVTYSVNGQRNMKAYRCFLDVLVVGICALFFCVMVTLQDQSLPSAHPSWVTASSTQTHSHAGVPRIASRRTCLVWFLGIAILDCFSLYTTLLASHDISPPLRAILQQLTVPFSMAASYLFIKRRYSMVHVVAAVAIVIGITMCMANVLVQSVGQESSPTWSLAYVLACVAMAVSGCLKEYLLVNPQFTLGIHVVNAWVASFQFLMGIALTPLGIIAQNLGMSADSQVSIYDLPENFYGGFRCGILGLNTYNASGDPLYGFEDCGSSVISTWLYVITMFAFNVLMLLVIRQGTVVLFFMSTSVTLCVVSILSCTSLYDALGLSVGVYTHWQVLGLVITVLGTMIFQSFSTVGDTDGNNTVNQNQATHNGGNGFGYINEHHDNSDQRLHARLMHFHSGDGVGARHSRGSSINHSEDDEILWSDNHEFHVENINEDGEEREYDAYVDAEYVDNQDAYLHSEYGQYVEASEGHNGSFTDDLINTVTPVLRPGYRRPSSNSDIS